MTRGLTHLIKEKPKIIIEFYWGSNFFRNQNEPSGSPIWFTAFGENQNFDNLPVIFKLLAEILQNEEPGLTKEITTLLKILQQRSEQETAFFLKQQLAASCQTKDLPDHKTSHEAIQY